MCDNSDGCLSCGEEIGAGEEKLECNSVCDRSVHLSCTQMGKTVLKAVMENENIGYTCDDCISNSLKTVNNKVNGIFSFLYRFETKLNDIQNNVDEMKLSMNAQTEINLINQNNNKTTVQKKVVNAKETNVNSKSPAWKNKNNNRNKPGPSKNVANVENNKTKNEYDPVVVVRPKNPNQNSETTKEDIKKKMGAISGSVYDIQYGKLGKVIIKCKSKKDSDAVRTEMQQKLGDSYDVNNAETVRPKVKLFGVTEKITEKDLAVKIKAQNKSLANSDLNVIKVFGDTKKSGVYNAILEVDKKSLDILIEMKKVLVNWDSCRITEHFNILRCFKCNGYGHTQAECTRKQTCGKCGSDHDRKDCTATTFECINCKILKEKTNEDIQTNHGAWDKKCVVYLKKVDGQKKRVHVKETEKPKPK